MILAMVDDIRVILVKLADRLHNMRTLSTCSESRPSASGSPGRRLEIYAPIANRLGIGRIKPSWRTWRFSYLEPDASRASWPGR